MKRFGVTLLAVLWGLILIAGICQLPNSLSGGSFNPMKFNCGINVGSVLLKEETIYAEGVTAFELRGTYQGIEVKGTDAALFHIEQYGGENTSPDGYFQIRRDGGHVTVTVESSITIGLNLSRDRLVIEVPRAWTGDVALASASGSIRVQDEFQWARTELFATSGSLQLERPLHTGDCRMDASSGSIKAEGALEASGTLAAQTRSGSIRLEGFVTAQSISCETSSGAIHADTGLTAESGIQLRSTSGSMHAEGENNAPEITVHSTSGSVRLGRVYADRFDISSTSGSVRAEALSGTGTLKSTSGSVNAELVENVGDVRATSMSGSVKLTVPYNLSFLFEGDSGSGGIHTDFEILYRNNRKNSAVGTVGDSPHVTISTKTTSGSIRVERNG